MTTAQKIHVLHIASGDLWAGAEVQLFTLARALQKRDDIRVTVLLMNDGELAKRMRDAGIDVIVLPEDTLGFAQLLKKTISLVSSLRPDIIHTHRIKENILGGITGLMLRTPSLRTQHGAEEHPASWRAPHKKLLQQVNYWLAAHVQRFVVAVTPDLGDTLRKKLPPERVTVIENGIDPSNFHLVDPSLLEPRFQNAKRRVGIVGRLAPVKRIDLFIDMAAIIANDNAFTDVSFFVIGDGPLRKSMEARAADLGLAKRLFFLGHQEAIHSYLKQLDALVMTSDHEGLPMTLLEAMSLGVCVIGHNVGGIKLLLQEGENGVAVNSHTAAGYAAALKLTLLNDKETKTRCNNARARVEISYSALNNAEAFSALYTLVSSRASSTRSP